MTLDTHPLDRLIAKLDSLYELKEDDRAAFRELPCKVRSLDPSSYLVREGDRPDRCSVLMTGFAYRQKITGDGARQIMAIHIPGEAVDFQNLFLNISDHNVQMLTRGEVADIPSEALQRVVMDRPAVGRAVLIATLIEASIFREWVLNIGRRDSRSRIAHVLCEFALRLESAGMVTDGHFELPMTQEQIADATGLTPVHVNRVLKSLEGEDLIQRNRRTISFPSWRRMQEVGDFNARYLHLKADAD